MKTWKVFVNIPGLFSVRLWLFFQRFLYRQLMYCVAVKSTLMAIHGRVGG
jgi:hypothetical protein